MRRHVPVLIAVLTALLLAACGGGGGDAASDATTSLASPAAGGNGQDTEVTIESFDYMPGELEVSAGTTVTWTNQDAFAHTVTSGTPDEPTDRFDGELGELGERNGQGTTFSYTFEEPGTYEYFCRFHPQQMRATVVVTE